MAALIFVAMFALIPVRRHAGVEAARVSSAWGGLGRELRRTVRETGEGIAYMRRDATIFAVLLVNFFIVLMSMPYMQMMAGFVKQVLDGGPEALGAAQRHRRRVAGGSLAVASMPNRGRGLAFLVSAFVLGLALLAFSISTWLWATALIMVVIGLGQAGRMSLSNILLMAYTEPSLQGRVMSVYMMEFSMVSFGTFIVGVLAELLGVQWAIGATAVALIVIAAVVCCCAARARLP
jgi:MFS family permease